MKNKPQQTLKSREQFLRFFIEIPRNKWTTCGNYQDGHGRRCAFGHVGCETYSQETPNGRNLVKISELHPKVGLGLTVINDKRSVSFPQRSAKARVLALLRELPEGTTA